MKKTTTSTMYVDATCYVPSSTPGVHPLVKQGGILKCTSSRTGEPLPKHKDLISKNKSATTILDAYRQSVKIKPGKSDIVFTDKPGQVYIDTYQSINAGVLPLTLLGSSLFKSLEKEAVAKGTASAYKKIAEYQSTFSGQVFTGELKEVFQLIRNPLGSVYKLVASFIPVYASKRGLIVSRKGLSAKQQAKALADLWLELRFAVLPLISDINDLLTLATDLALKRMRETFRGFGKSEDSTTVTYISGATSGVEYLRTNITKRSVMNIVRGGVYAEFLDKLESRNVNAFIDSVDDVMSLPLTAFELTPLSFLINYVVNIEDLITSTVTSTHQVAYISNSLIKEETQIARIDGVLQNRRPDLVRSISLIERKEVITSVRQVTRGAALPGIVPVVFSLPGSNIRYANILALAVKKYL